MLEAAASVLILGLFTLAILTLAYVLVARSWLQYQSEQALYCMAEGHLSAVCERDLKSHVKAILPWGSLQAAFDSRTSSEWSLKLKWTCNEFKIEVQKSLRMRDIARTRGLLL